MEGALYHWIPIGVVISAYHPISYINIIHERFVMKWSKKIRRSTKQYMIVALICIFVIGGAATGTIFVVVRQVKNEYQILLEQGENERKRHQRDVFIASKAIVPGEIISKDNMSSQMVYTSSPADLDIREADLGKMALLAIPKGTHVLQVMVTEPFAENVREVEFGEIYLPVNISSNDYVDIRILYPNGENYIILSKKLVRNMSEDRLKHYFWLGEEEIQLMSSAIVDAYLYDGAKLYSTKYVEASMQESSVMTYVPSLSTMELIKDNPNIITIASESLRESARKLMENRLALFGKQDVEETSWTVEERRLSEQEEEERLYYYQEEVDEREVDIEYGQ